MLDKLTDQIGSRPLGLARVIIGTAAAIRAAVAWPILTKLTEPRLSRLPISTGTRNRRWRWLWWCFQCGSSARS